LGILVHQAPRGHQVAGDGLELGSGQPSQLGADLAVEVGGGDLVGHRRCCRRAGRLTRRRWGTGPLRAGALGLVALVTPARGLVAPAVATVRGRRVAATGFPAAARARIAAVRTSLLVAPVAPTLTLRAPARLPVSTRLPAAAMAAVPGLAATAGTVPATATRSVAIPAMVTSRSVH